jgi:SlyX protein
MRDQQTRIDELEIRLSFQEQLLETLNQQISQQQLSLIALQRHVVELAAALRAMPGSTTASSSAHEPPPHY